MRLVVQIVNVFKQYKLVPGTQTLRFVTGIRLQLAEPTFRLRQIQTTYDNKHNLPFLCERWPHVPLVRPLIICGVRAFLRERQSKAETARARTATQRCVLGTRSKRLL